MIASDQVLYTLTEKLGPSFVLNVKRVHDPFSECPSRDELSWRLQHTHTSLATSF